MFKRGSFFIYLMIMSQVLLAQGIVFESGTIEEAFQKAKASNKLVFVDVYTTWCGPCKTMSKEVFPQVEVGAAYNTRYISYQIDAEKEENKAFTEKYDIKAYPTLMYLGNDGKLIIKTVGRKTKEEFIALAAAAPKEQKESKSLEYYQSHYEANKRNKAFVKDYILKKKRIGMTFQQEFDQYLSLLTNKEKVLPDIIDMYRQNKDQITIWTASYKNLKNNAILLFPAMKMEIYRYMVAAINTSLESIIKEKNEKLLEELIAENYFVQNTNVEEKSDDALRIKYYRGVGDFKKLTLYTTNYCNNFLMKLNVDSLKHDLEVQLAKVNEVKKEGIFGNFFINQDSMMRVVFESKNNLVIEKYAQPLNSHAWSFFELISDEEAINQAIQWSKKSLELKPNNPHYLDTYANLLYKKGDVQAAIPLQTKAVELAIQLGINKDDKFEERLEKMKRNEKTW